MHPSTPWVAVSPADARPASAPDPLLSLVCFPSAGNNSSLFEGWSASLPPRCALLPVELPGRNARRNEAPGRDLKAAAGEAAAALAPLLRGKPYALLGHSVGAWLAFEVSLALQRNGAPGPVRFYALACRAPCLAGADHEPDPPRFAHLPDSPPFWARVERRYGRNPLFHSSAGVRAFAHPVLSSDLAMSEGYEWDSAADERLACPVAAVWAPGDGRCGKAQALAWGRHTTAGGGFEAVRVETQPHAWATPHRTMVQESRGALLAWLAKDIDKLMARHE